MTSDADIFADALERPPERRAAFLAAACPDPAQRERVATLLRSHDKAQAAFGSPLVARPDGAAASDTGAVIGAYKLLERLGEGGCGVVWMAQQEVPVRRRVALKIIKLGMDTKEVIARFEAERQALALMEHPNIAKMFDAGATSAGRPYFVMELVRGQPITRYCDERNVPTAQRLALFMQVCRAVQHAHEKGIVHRDIKPSNILVTHEDGEPLPKVIDFGVAKATQGRLTDRTLFTAFEQFIGTPAYMSPEQADYHATEIDHRSDVYSLGALLYELLAGRPPFDPKTLNSHGIEEVRRIIREVDPPRPSTRLSTLADAERTLLAQHHSAVPAQHATQLRGDLDWIVMKALDKNRTRRYVSAAAFADDVQRHLEFLPVTARPPSAGYQVQKFVRRHRVAVAGGSVAIAALAVGVTLTVWQARRAAQAEKENSRILDARSHEMAEFFAVGRNPYGAVFDGGHIWVCNQGEGTVTKLRARDGARIGTYAVGGMPFAATFDGKHVWVTNQNSHSVSKLVAATGELAGTYPCGNGPTGIGFDGTHLWIGNVGVNTVTKLDAATGAIVAAFPCHSARGVAFDRRHIWVCNHSDGTVTKFVPATGEVVGTYPVGKGAYAIVFDGATLWVANIFADSVTKLDPQTGRSLGEFPVGASPRALAFDGRDIWVANGKSDNVSRLDAATGRLVATYPAGHGPFGMVFDGRHVWVVNQDSGSIKRL